MKLLKLITNEYYKNSFSKIAIIAFILINFSGILLFLVHYLGKDFVIENNFNNWKDYLFGTLDMTINFFTPIAVTIIGISIFNLEYNEGTLKNLLVCGYNRNKIILSKIFYGISLIFITFLISLGTNFLLLRLLNYNYECIDVLNYFKMHILSSVYSIPLLLLMVLLIIIIKNSFIVFAISFSGLIVSSVIKYIIPKFILPWNLPSTVYQLELENYFFINNIYFIIYFITFLLLALYFFSIEDIK
jgi:ABC-type transport system involved in multi-copper enzyme maturation permease subunit